MTEKRTAKERKQAAKKRSTKAVESAAGKRESSKITYYSREPDNETIKKSRAKMREKMMGKPVELSAAARFDMLKPANIHPFDWVQLFTADESLWPDIVEEALAAIQEGELAPYDGPVKGG